MYEGSNIVSYQYLAIQWDHLYVGRAYEEGVRDKGEKERLRGEAPNSNTHLEQSNEKGRFKDNDELYGSSW